MAIRAVDVFTPGAFPESLRDALQTPGQVVSLSGPSKSGKTVLVERVVGKDLLILITGVSIRSPEDVWRLVLDWMDIPTVVSSSREIGATVGAEISAKGG